METLEWAVHKINDGLGRDQNPRNRAYGTVTDKNWQWHDKDKDKEILGKYMKKATWSFYTH